MAEIVLFCVIVGIIILITFGNFINYIINNKNEASYKVCVLERPRSDASYAILKIKTTKGIHLNFILDTGANINVINKNNIGSFDAPEMLDKINVQSIQENREYDVVLSKFYISDCLFEDRFTLSDISHLNDLFKSNYNIEIHGIIGNVFFQKHKCVINFQNYTFWHR